MAPVAFGENSVWKSDEIFDPGQGDTDQDDGKDEFHLLLAWWVAAPFGHAQEVDQVHWWGLLCRCDARYHSATVSGVTRRATASPPFNDCPVLRALRSCFGPRCGA